MYRFNLLVDLVFNIMHIRGLNMFKNYISDFFEHIHLINYDEEVAKFYDVIGAARLHKLRTRRWPYNLVEYHHAFKAEENQKFI